MFIGRTDIEAETPILWPPDVKSWLFWKDPGAGKDWRQEETGTTADEMVGWHHQLDGHAFEQALGVSDGQGSLMCYSSWGHKESDTTEQPNWTELSEIQFQSINQSFNQFNLNKNKDNISKAEKMPKYIYCGKFRIKSLCQVFHHLLSIHWEESLHSRYRTKKI